MKFLSFILLYLICSFISSKITITKSSYQVHFNSNSNSYSESKSKQAKPFMMLFGEGLNWIMTGKKTGFEECAPASWKKVDNPNKQAVITIAKKIGDVFNMVVNGVKGTIKSACKVKGTIIGWLKRKLRRRVNRRRFFINLKTKVRRIKMKKWLISSVKKLWNKAKNVVSNVANKVVNTVKSLADKVMDGVGGIFKGIITRLKDIYNFFKNLFKSNVFTEVITFVNCLNKTNPKINAYVRSFLSAKTALLGSWGGAISAIMKLVCQFKEFEKASEYIKAGNLADEDHIKFMDYGKFIGQLVIAFGSAKI